MIYLSDLIMNEVKISGKRRILKLLYSRIRIAVSHASRCVANPPAYIVTSMQIKRISSWHFHGSMSLSARTSVY